MMLASGPSASSLLDALAAYATGRGQNEITDFLTSHGLSADAAGVIAGAIVNRGTVSMPDGTSIPLSALIQPLLPSGTSVPPFLGNLAITSLTFSPGVGQALSFDAVLGGTTQIGGATLTVGGEVSLSSSSSAAPALANADQASGSGLTANLAVSLTGSQTTFNASCSLLSSETTLTFKWSSVDDSPLGVGALFGLFGCNAPAALDTLDKDVGFTDVGFDIDLTQEQSQYTFRGTSKYQKFHAFALLDSTSTGWKMAFGVSLDGGIRSFPIVGGSLGDALSFLHIDAALLLAASEPIPDFDVSTLLGDDAASAWPMKVTLQNAFTIGAVLDVDASDNAAVQKLASMPAVGFSGKMLLEVMLPTPKVQVDLADLRFKGCTADLSLYIDATPKLELDGKLTVAALGNTEFDATLGVTPEEISGTLTVLLEDSLELPLVPGIFLDEIGGSVGVNDGGEVTGGFLGAFHLKGENRTANGKQLAGFTSGASELKLDNQFALVLGIDALGVPDLDLFLLQLEKVSVSEIVKAVTGKDASDPLFDTLDGLSINNLLLYYCSPVAIGSTLPDGSSAAQGFKFHGALDAWGHDAWCAITIATTDVSGELYLAPILLPDESGTFLSIRGDGNTDPGPQALAAGVGTGGPLISVDSSGSPYLTASWHVKVLDAAENIVDVNVTNNSFTFSVANNLPGLGATLTCSLTEGAKRFHLEADGHIKETITLPSLLGVDLGQADLDSDFHVAIDLDVSSTVSLTVNATFQFAGDTLSVSFAPTIPITSIGNVPSALIDYIKNNAETVFKTALDEATQLINTFGGKAIEKLVAGAATAIVKDLEHVVAFLAGRHGVNNKTQPPPWMQDKSLVKGDGAPIYAVRHGVLRHIPGDDGAMTTYNWLSSPSNCGQPYSIGDIVLSLMPKDTDDIPSLVEGGIIAKDDGSQPWYLVLYSGGNPAKYSITNKTTFQTRTGVQSYKQLAADEDIHWLLPENSDLASGLCLIAGDGDGGAKKYLFVDGMKIWVENPDTLLTLRKNLQSGVILPQATVDKIPVLTQSLLENSTSGALNLVGITYLRGVSSDQIYEVQNHQLQKLKLGGHGSSKMAIVPLFLDDDLMGALNYA